MTNRPSLSPCHSIPPKAQRAYRLTVRLLVSGAGTWTAKLLWLAPSVVGNEEGSVVLNKRLLELVLGVLVNELLVVGDLDRVC